MRRNIKNFYYNIEKFAKHFQFLCMPNKMIENIFLLTSNSTNFERNEWKNPQFNFSSQNFSLELNFFKWYGNVTKISRLLFHRIWKRNFLSKKKNRDWSVKNISKNCLKPFIVKLNKILKEYILFVALEYSPLNIANNEKSVIKRKLLHTTNMKNHIYCIISTFWAHILRYSTS